MLQCLLELFIGLNIGKEVEEFINSVHGTIRTDNVPYVIRVEWCEEIVERMI